jgi:hypothetical protein
MDERLIPFYLIGHNPNTLEEAEKFLANGANALEPDVQRDIFTGELRISHDRRSDSAEPVMGTALITYLDGLRDLANRFSGFAMVMFDSKLNDAASGLELHTAVQRHLAGTGLIVIYSVGSLDMVAFLDPIIQGATDREGVMVDEEPSAKAVVSTLEARGAVRIGYGNGVLVSLPAPNVHKQIDNALVHRAISGRPQFIDTWVLAAESSIIDYMRMGIDGIIVNIDTVPTAIGYLQRPELAQWRALAPRSYNPFIATHRQWVLQIKTLDRSSAGTNSNITFTLEGTGPDRVDVIVDASAAHRYESGSVDHVTMFEATRHLGTPTSLTLSKDNAGIAPDWLPDRIEVHESGQPVLYADVGEWITSSGNVTRRLGTSSYAFVVETSDVGSAGTDADITFTLKGTNGEVQRRINSYHTDWFERGNVNAFDIRGIDIGDLVSLHISNDGSGNGPDWHLAKVRVTPNTGASDKTFLVDRWVNANSSIMALP